MERINIHRRKELALLAKDSLFWSVMAFFASISTLLVTTITIGEYKQKSFLFFILFLMMLQIYLGNQLFYKKKSKSVLKVWWLHASFLQMREQLYSADITFWAANFSPLAFVWVLGSLWQASTLKVMSHERAFNRHCHIYKNIRTITFSRNLHWSGIRNVLSWWAIHCLGLV